MERFNLTIKPPKESGADWMLTLRADSQADFENVIHEAIGTMSRALGIHLTAVAAGPEPPANVVRYETDDAAQDDRWDDGEIVCQFSPDRCTKSGQPMNQSRQGKGYYCPGKDPKGDFCRCRWAPDRGYFQVNPQNQRRSA